MPSTAGGVKRRVRERRFVELRERGARAL